MRVECFWEAYFESKGIMLYSEKRGVTDEIKFSLKMCQIIVR